jgi:hypothetical protein
MCTVQLPPAGNPLAVNKYILYHYIIYISYIIYRVSYIISYHTISYIIYHTISYITSYQISYHISYHVSYIISYIKTYQTISYHIISYIISYISITMSGLRTESRTRGVLKTQRVPLQAALKSGYRWFIQAISTVFPLTVYVHTLSFDVV